MTFETILDDELIGRYTAQGHWVDRVITDYLDDAAARTPDKTAFVDSRRRVTYRELKDEVDRCALGLLELGIGGGDVISFQLPNWIEWIVLHHPDRRDQQPADPDLPRA